MEISWEFPVANNLIMQMTNININTSLFASKGSKQSKHRPTTSVSDTYQLSPPAQIHTESTDILHINTDGLSY